MRVHKHNNKNKFISSTFFTSTLSSSTLFYFHSLYFHLFLLFCTDFRSRRKARSEQKRIRIRPCLSVCQKVEQICPYMLPADRAPAYPTQYAGEPTFFCLGKFCNFSSSLHTLLILIVSQVYLYDN